MLIWEPFTAAFTGKLKTFTTKNGYTFTLDNDGMSVVKGQPFMVQFDQDAKQIRIVPVRMPNPHEGRR